MATRDLELMESCRELGIEARFPDEVGEEWPEEEKKNIVKEGGS